MVPTILIVSNPYDLCKHNSDKGSIFQPFLNVLPIMPIIPVMPIVPITKYITSYITSTFSQRFYYRHYINYGKTNSRYIQNLIKNMKNMNNMNNMKNMKNKNIPLFKSNV